MHDPADENNFFVYEIFESEAALDAHGRPTITKPA
ncbi:hypothetical protein [Cereibacter sphaeroides]|nr:hypothetical protein [Cereibacter sphaeroides]